MTIEDERTMSTYTDKQIHHMVSRFLAWRLPTDFAPDGGVSFKATFNDHLPTPMRHEPSGTNLLNYTQAEAMVRHMLEGLPHPPPRRPVMADDDLEEAKARTLPERIALLNAALAGLPEHWGQWQWVADQKPVFGEKRIRSVYGDNGHGMGRQAIAIVPADKHYFGTLADFIAAANPDTIAMLLASHASLEERVEEAKRLMGPAIEAGRSFEPVGGFRERALEGWAAALAAFVNEKET